MIWLDDQLLAERKYLKSKLDEMDAKIADTFQYQFAKMVEAGDDRGIVEIIGQLPGDFRNIAVLYHAALDIQTKRKAEKA
jgi:hypothetical protein